MAAGTQTMKAPSIGIIERKIITTPHSSGEGSPSAQKASPPSTPCIVAMTSTP